MTRSDIKEHMEVIGADGVHIGTVDRVENNKIKLTKADSGEQKLDGFRLRIDLQQMGAGAKVSEVEFVQ